MTHRMLLIAVLAVFTVVLPTRAAVLSRWVQYDADGAVEARIVTDEAACPPLLQAGRAIGAHERAPEGGDFPVRLCTARLAGAAGRLAVEGLDLPAVAAAPRRIVVLGDTGCRVLGRVVQDCRNPAAWPFRRVARQAAARHPDLVLHVGDYLYREAPCPPGNAGCAGSPSGDNWATWQADFFTPAARLLAAAPWVFVRGNHETCSRAGLGWTRLLSALPFDPRIPCRANEPPYAVALAALRLLVFDDASARDFPADEQALPTYRTDLAALGNLARGSSWLLMHRPLRGVARFPSGLVVGGNRTLLQASRAPLPAAVGLLLSGHIHAFEAINYSAGPPQFVVGNGGDWLNAAPARLDGLTIGGLTVTQGLSLPGFGFLLLVREGSVWRAEAYDTDGTMERRCHLAAARIVCAAPGSSPRAPNRAASAPSSMD